MLGSGKRAELVALCRGNWVFLEVVEQGLKEQNVVVVVCSTVWKDKQ